MSGPVPFLVNTPDFSRNLLRTAISCLLQLKNLKVNQ